jgi:hypothetical protein
MKYRFILVSVALLFVYSYSWTQTDTAVVFGVLGKDFNRPSGMIKLPGGNLIWIGEWNNEGILMKISPSGKEIKRILLSNIPGAITRMKDILLDEDNTLITAGECIKCSSTDSFSRVILYRIDTSLEKVLAKSIISGTTVGIPLIYNPSIARYKNTMMLIATQAGPGMDNEDTYLASINSQLDTLWTKSINSCEECLLEFPYSLVASANGFTTFIYHNYTDSATIFHFDASGQILWKQRPYTWNGVAGGAISVYKDKIYIGVGVRGLPLDPFFFVATILTYDEIKGIPLSAVPINDPYTDRAITSLEFAKNGNLLVGYRRSIPSFNGSLLTSQVLRLDLLSPTPRFIDSKLIPNPGDITNMGVVRVLPLNDDGSKISTIGIRGANRTFYFTNNETTVAVHDFKFGSTFSINPNPVREYQPITIRLPETWSTGLNRSISIYNISEMLIKHDFNIPSGLIYTIPGLPKGIYAIVFKNNHVIVTKKLLVL